MPSNGPTDQAPDQGSLDAISPEECWRLLTTEPVGRVSVIVGHHPLVFPVNFALDGHSILYRTSMGTKVESIHRSNVTFEVDRLDPLHRSGWSVMVKGVAQELSADRDQQAISQAEFAGATPWAPGRRDHFVRIIAVQITGRRIRPGDVSPGTDPRGYR
jgi:nitroimidazol reductase NimA-like FMN-containing flavoprotein (pyridoxamine 5'-phosphate oxidase superfamily)